MSGGVTFRQAIDMNKRCVMEFLLGKNFIRTDVIKDQYKGEKDIYQVRKALKELEKEGKIEFIIHGINYKSWRIKQQTQ